MSQTFGLYEPQPHDSGAVWSVQESLSRDFEISVVKVILSDVTYHPVFSLLVINELLDYSPFDFARIVNVNSVFNSLRCC